MSEHKKVLSALSLQFLRLGAAALIQDMEEYEKNSLSSGAPLFIGANGKKKGKEKDKKRGRGSVDKEWLKEMQPQLKRLSKKEQPESIALKIARNMLLLPEEIIEIAMEYMLRPIFPEQQGSVQTIVSRSNRMGVAMKEYQLRKAAYHALLDLTNKNRELKLIARILRGSGTRKRTYAWWLQKQTAPLWVGKDRYAGPAFSATQAREYAQGLPLGFGEDLGWYTHFLANALFHWHFSELAREVWSAGLQGHKPDKYIGWPGARGLWKHPLHIGITRDLMTEGWSADARATVDINIGGVIQVDFWAHNFGGKPIAVRGLKKRRTHPPQTKKQIEWVEEWEPSGPYPKGGTFRTPSLFEQTGYKLRRQYVIQLSIVLTQVTLLRIPTILWDLEKYGAHAYQNLVPIPRSRYANINFTYPKHVSPYILFDEPLRAYNPNTSSGPWVFDLPHPPAFNKAGDLRLRNIRILNLTNAEHGVSRWIRAHRLESSSMRMTHVLRPQTGNYQGRPRLYLPDRDVARTFSKDEQFGLAVVKGKGFEEPLLNVLTGEQVEMPISNFEVSLRFMSPPAWLAIVRSPVELDDDDDDDDDSEDDDDDDDDDWDDDTHNFWN